MSRELGEGLIFNSKAKRNIFFAVSLLAIFFIGMYTNTILNPNIVPEDNYDEGYDDGYNNGYDYGVGNTTEPLVSLNVTISDDFFVNVTNDGGDILNNTTWDIRRLVSTSIIIDLETTNSLYEYCAENPTDTVNLTDHDELYTKLGINITSLGMSMVTFADALYLFDDSSPNFNSLIGRTFVILLNKVIMPTFNIYLYANNSVFNGSDYTGDDETLAFGFCIADFIPFLMSGLIVDQEILEDTTIFKTYNENELILEELILDVDGGTYEIVCSLNGEDVEIFSGILFG